MGTDSVPSELDELAEEIGEFICYWGFKKIHGRIWTHLYLSSEPLDAGQLMRRLDVSKALMSLSLGDLLEFDVILEGPKSTRGTQTYIANPHILDAIFNVLRRRERKMLAKTEMSHRLLASMSPSRMAEAHIHPERVDGMGNMIQEAMNTLGCILELATIDMGIWEKLIAPKAEKKTPSR